MAGHGLKSNTKHPYQKFMIPFWRESKETLMGYSEESKEIFERKKIEFDANAKYIQWEVKSKDTIQ